jgi:hypothetical protein
MSNEYFTEVDGVLIQLTVDPNQAAGYIVYTHKPSPKRRYFALHDAKTNTALELNYLDQLGYSVCHHFFDRASSSDHRVVLLPGVSPTNEEFEIYPEFKPFTREVFHYTSYEALLRAPPWCQRRLNRLDQFNDTPIVLVSTFLGMHALALGDYLIRLPNGYIQRMEPAEYQERYEGKSSDTPIP